MNVFLDTNVVLDVLAHRAPFYDDSVKVWALGERGRIRALLSAVSVTNLYYIVRKQTSAARAMEMLRDLRSVASFVACDGAVIHHAIDAGFADFEDAVQYFSAVAGGADCLVTRNPVHYPHPEIPVLTPREFLAAHTFA